jgi:hypothetical protein
LPRDANHRPARADGFREAHLRGRPVHFRIPLTCGPSLARLLRAELSTRALYTRITNEVKRKI